MKRAIRTTHLTLATFMIVIAASAQTADPQPDKDGVYSPGDGVKSPKIVHTAPAHYPADPRLASFKHSCIVDSVIEPGGTQIGTQSEGEQSPFDSDAIEAVKASEFKPGTVHGKAVPVRVRVWVPFIPGEKNAVPEILPARIVSVGKLDRPAIPIITPEPEYTEAAKLAKFEGVALVHVLVDTEGNPQDIRVLRPIGKGLDEKAIEAATKYKFAPALRWGMPIPFPVTIEMNFRLPRSSR
jgi:TonB family protein